MTLYRMEDGGLCRFDRVLTNEALSLAIFWDHDLEFLVVDTDGDVCLYRFRRHAVSWMEAVEVATEELRKWKRFLAKFDHQFGTPSS